MKKLLSFGLGLAVLAFHTAPLSASAAEADKEVKLTGEGKCGKCALKKAEKCQNVISVTENGKTVDYWLTPNQVSKDFHSNICSGTKKVTAVGKVKQVDGKKELTVSKIELAKE